MSRKTAPWQAPLAERDVVCQQRLFVAQVPSGRRDLLAEGTYWCGAQSSERRTASCQRANIA